jgi:hypothetical protein
MTAIRTRDTHDRVGRPATSAPSHTLVWIDAREAIIVRWVEDQAVVERIASDVPVHRRSTGHVRHDPLVRHGGGGSPQDAGEADRLEHLARYLKDVAERLPATDDLTVLGPGTVRGRLVSVVRRDDRRHRVQRAIDTRPAPPTTEPELVARLRALLSRAAPRWSSPHHGTER